jgi:hypothetical protein
MQDKIIILKNTKNGVVKDTIMSVQDTLRLSLENIIKLKQPQETLVVKTITEPLSGIETFGLWVAAILAVLGIIHIVIQLKKLLKNDNELQSQINELVKLNHLFERRLRMTVKPHLFQNGSGYLGADHTIFINLNNRGGICYYKGFEVLEGEGDFRLEEWEPDITIDKDKYIKLTGRTNEHPTATYFKIKVLYYDRENYQYETIIEWNNSRVAFLETNDL